MAESSFDRLKDIGRRFQRGELSLHDAAREAGLSENAFEQVVRKYAWAEEKAGQASNAAGSAARAGRNLLRRWTHL